MTAGDTRMAAALALVHRFVPGFQVISKAVSRVHRIIGALFAVLGNKLYMERVWTTLRYVTAAPSTEDDGFSWYAWQTLLHEGWHGMQWRRKGLWMGVSYLLPQLVAALVLVVPILAWLVGPGAWWGLLALLALAPWPAYWRARLEAEAYQVSVALDYWTWGRQPTNFPDWVVDRFTSPVYYWMWPFKSAVRRRFEDWAQALRDGTWERDVADPDLLDYLRECQVLALQYREAY